MKRFLMVSALLTLTAAAAHAAPLATFTTVDEFERTQNFKVSITGVLAGQSTSQANTYMTQLDSYYGNGGTGGGESATGNACERFAAIMMNRPGRFQLQINIDPTDSNYVVCRLIVVKQ
jgi:hypothetical protein